MAKILMEVGDDGVAIITINNPPINLLSGDAMPGFKECCEQALGRDDVKATVITGSNKTFSGGFNITSFGQKRSNSDPGLWSIKFITDTIEAARKPFVAAIDGPALGGGLEIALACHARISTSSAKLGLPELQYGIIPGFGGTQRLPRLVGLSKALEIMLMSKYVNGVDAHSLGLVDAIVPAEGLLETARQWALDIQNHNKPWTLSLYKSDKLDPLVEARAMLAFARTEVQKITPNLEHHLVCIDVIEDGIVSGPRSGLWKETNALEELRQSDTCRSLVHYFFSQRATTKIPGITDQGLIPRKLNRIAVVGGGLMGSGIATTLILSNYIVILKEVNEKLLQAGVDRIKENLQDRFKKGELTEGAVQKTFSLLKGVLDYESFKDVDMVIEAVSEDISLKQKIFSDLECYCPNNCIFASNTSSINLNLLGENTKSQNQIVGCHFFSPDHVNSMVEIIRTDVTSRQVIVDLLGVCKKIKKTPIVVRNCTGFAVNRMFFQYLEVALMLVEHGIDIYRIDQAVMKFGMPMGPYRMTDLVGFEVSIALKSQFMKEFPLRSYKSMLTWLMHEDGRVGESTQKGYYLYNKGKASPDPEIKEYVDKARSISGATIDPELVKLPDEHIVEMIFFPVVNEACRLLEEDIVIKATDLNAASVLGMGFPQYRGGVIFWADNLGPKYICTKLEAWSKKYGSFFKPCNYLATTALKETSLGTSVYEKSRL